MFTATDEKFGGLTLQMYRLYKDFKLTSTEDLEKLGYLIFQARSIKNDQYHEIRAFNSNSVYAQADNNRAKTLFHQEAMRCHTRVPECFVLNSLEINDTKSCYALKSRSFSLLDKKNGWLIQKFDFCKFLQDILEDIEHLSLNGLRRVKIPAERVYQIGHRYFLQDWNQISPLECSDGKNPECITSLGSTAEEDNIYELGLMILELLGYKRDEIRALKSTSYYERNIEILLESINSDISLTQEQKKLVLRMLDKDPKKRPEFTDLLKGVNKIDGSLGHISIKPNIMNSLVEIKNHDYVEKQENQFSHADDQSNSVPVLTLPNGSKFSDLQKMIQKIRNPSDIKELNATGSNIGYEGATLLGNDNTWKNLTALNLRENSIGDQGLTALSNNTSWTKLVTLDLRGNLISAQGINALNSNNSWVNLKSLILRDNKLGTEGANILSKNSVWTNLTTLNLQGNSIGAEGARALTKNGTWTKLISLDLGNNSIGAEGTAALSMNTKWTKITTLILHNNDIGLGGAIELALNTCWIELKELDLINNKIGEQGLEALVNNQSWKNLKILKLQGNSIGAEAQKLFELNKPSIKLSI